MPGIDRQLSCLYDSRFVIYNQTAFIELTTKVNKIGQCMLIKIYFSAQSALTKEELRRDLAQAASVFAARVSSIVYLIINTKT